MGEQRGEPPKEDVARTLLLRGPLFVHVDPSEVGVALPGSLMDEMQAIIRIDLDMRSPDLRVDARGISGTMDFDRGPFFCMIPWNSVYAVTGEDGRGMVWPASMPKEIDAEVQREMGQLPPQGLRVVHSRPSAGTPMDDTDEEAIPVGYPDELEAMSHASARSGAHLRLVK